MPWVRAVGWSECFTSRAPCLFCSEWSCVFIWTPGPCPQVPQRIGGQLRARPCEVVQALQVPNTHQSGLRMLVSASHSQGCSPRHRDQSCLMATKLYPHVDRTVSELGLTRSLPISHRECWEVSHWFCQGITCRWDNLSAFPLWTPKGNEWGQLAAPTKPVNLASELLQQTDLGETLPEHGSLLLLRTKKCQGNLG